MRELPREIIIPCWDWRSMRIGPPDVHVTQAITVQATPTQHAITTEVRVEQTEPLVEGGRPPSG